MSNISNSVWDPLSRLCCQLSWLMAKLETVWERWYNFIVWLWRRHHLKCLLIFLLKVLSRNWRCKFYKMCSHFELQNWHSIHKAFSLEKGLTRTLAHNLKVNNGRPTSHFPFISVDRSAKERWLNPETVTVRSCNIFLHPSCVHLSWLFAWNFRLCNTKIIFISF